MQYQENWLAPRGHCYFLENTTFTVLLKDVVCINFSNVIKIVRTVFEKITILGFGGHVKGLCFWSWNIQIHQAPT
jgi:hypothetical protein